MVALFMLFSSAFADGEMIPVLYTADGSDISPPLSWSICQDAVSYALICEDPDAPAGDWVHWVVYNIPATVNSLVEGVPADSELVDCTAIGMNSWGRIGYGGPAPPSGTHRYYFRLYALDVTLELEPGATASELKAAMEGHLLDTAELLGRYGR